jgi:hypothetical protein
MNQRLRRALQWVVVLAAFAALCSNRTQLSDQ